MIELITSIFKNLSSWGLPVIVLLLGLIEFSFGLYEKKWTKNERTLDVVCFILPKIIIAPVVTYFSLRFLPQALPGPWAG